MFENEWEKKAESGVNLTESAHAPEPNQGAPVRRHLRGTVRRPQIASVVVPGTSAHYLATLAHFGRATRVGAPIRERPLPDVAQRVIEPPGVRRLSAHLMRHGAAIRFVPGDVIDIPISGAGRPSPRGILPLSLPWQSPARLFTVAFCFIPRNRVLRK